MKCYRDSINLDIRSIRNQHCGQILTSCDGIIEIQRVAEIQKLATD